MPETNPIRPTDDDARTLTKNLIAEARFGALGVIDPNTGAPSVTRIAIGTAPDGVPVTLISGLSAHTAALQADNRCSLLLGEPGLKGDPLTHPRITLDCRAAFLTPGSPDHETLRDHYLHSHPKAKLYVDFPDFRFVRFTVLEGRLNGGFGQAFVLTPNDLGP